MDLFGQLLEIKTWNKDLETKIIYISDYNSDSEFYEYYYDIKNHSFYINGLQTNNTNINTLEQVINKAYKQENSKKELSTFLDIINQMQMNKKPKVFYFTYSKDKEHICINKINLQTIRNSKLEILELKIWSVNYNS